MPTLRTPRRRLLVTAAVLTALIATLVVVVPHLRDTDPPFPLLGLVDDGPSAPHQVLAFLRTAAAPPMPQPLPGQDVAVPVSWDGALRWDGAWDRPLADLEDEDDPGATGDARLVSALVAHGRTVGIEVAGAEGVAWLLDPDGDEVIDLAVIRLLPDDAALPGYHPFALGSVDHTEIVVSRGDHGRELAALHEGFGLIGPACADADADPAVTRGTPVPEQLASRELPCTGPPVQVPPADPGAAAEQETVNPGTPSDPSDETTKDPVASPTGPQPMEGATIATASLTLPDTILSRPLRTALRGLPPIPPSGNIDSLRDDCYFPQQAFNADQLKLEVEEERLRRTRGLVDAFEDADFQRGLGEAVKRTIQGLEFRDAWRAAATDDARVGVLRKALVSEWESQAFKALLEGSSLDPGRQAVYSLLHDLVKAIITKGSLLSAVAGAELWAADQALKVAEILEGDGTETVERAKRKRDQRQAVLRECRERERRNERDGDAKSTGKGEPHITTFDGLHYDFQGVGEYWYSRGEGLDLQVRYSPLRDGRVSVATAVALRLPGTDSSVFIDAASQPDGAWSVLLDGVEHIVPEGAALLGDYRVTAVPGWLVRLEGPLGETVEVTEMTTERELLNTVSLRVPRDRTHLVEGGIGGDVDGDPANDLTTADGDTFDPRGISRDELYDGFGQSWRVKDPADSLFVYADGEGPDTFHNPRFPSGDVTLASFDRDQMEAALTTCLAAEVFVEPALSDCVFDVTVMDDDRWVESGQQTQSALATSPARGLALPGGTLTTPGTYVLWEVGDVRVTGFVTVVDTIGPARLALRGLLVERGGDTALVWPGWSDVPGVVELDGDAVLRLGAIGQHELVAELVGGTDVGGLATEPALTDDGVVPFELLDQWRSDWLVPV